MQKRRAGLQKDFSDIFDGVWIPKKPREEALQEDPKEIEDRVEDETLEQAKNIAERMKCDKDFQCVASGFSKLCEARLIGNGEMLECLENKQSCRFKVPFVNKAFCKCKLRFFIAKKMKKQNETNS